MYYSGLTSISFRKLTCEEIIDLAKGKVDAIEWGSDVHVRPGDVDRAAEVAAKTREAGLAMPSYGSYYYAGEGKEAFEPYIATAKVLGVKTIRIWAGLGASAECTPEKWNTIVADIARISKLAAAEGITISSEFHRNTMTDSLDSAMKLLADVRAQGGETFFTYWQPSPWFSEDDNKHNLATVMPYLSNVHIFHWDDKLQKYPIAAGKQIWGEYFDIIKAYDNGKNDRYVYIEFVADNDPANFPNDAAAVNEIVK